MLGLMLTRTHRRLMREAHVVQLAGHAARIQNLLTAQELDMSSLRLFQERRLKKVRDTHRKEISKLNSIIQHWKNI